MAVQNVPVVESHPVNAFVSSRGRGGGRSRGEGRGNPSQRGFNQRGYNPRQPHNQPPNPGNNERLTSCGDRIVCQICGKPGHPALDCYQRMNYCV